MSLDNKVVWSEGMFLNPHHFQQQERYLERYIDGRCKALGAYAWGFQELEIDRELLKLGKVSISKAKGVFPDGTPFHFPDIDEPPPVYELPENTHDVLVVLALPVRRADALDVIDPSVTQQGVSRYYSMEQSVRDVTAEDGESLKLNVCKPQLKLMLESDDLSGYSAIGLLYITESRDDKEILLDESYIPTILDCRINTRLSGFLTELVGMLHHRAEAISGRLADAQRGGSAEIADYMMLQVLNRLEPVFQHLSRIKGIHPEVLYFQLLQALGELSTFVTKDKRPPELPHYLHHDLQASFSPVMVELRKSLTAVYEQNAISLELVEKKFGIRVSPLSDKSLLTSATFVIAAKADIPNNHLRSLLPAQLRIAPVERIRQLVNAALPGIEIKPLPVAPRQIPYHTGFAYFELETQSQYWNELANSGGFAFHVGGDFPGLELEFWAIRQ